MSYSIYQKDRSVNFKIDNVTSTQSREHIATRSSMSIQHPAVWWPVNPNIGSGRNKRDSTEAIFVCNPKATQRLNSVIPKNLNSRVSSFLRKGIGRAADAITLTYMRFLKNAACRFSHAHAVLPLNFKLSVEAQQQATALNIAASKVYKIFVRKRHIGFKETERRILFRSIIVYLDPCIFKWNVLYSPLLLI